MGATLGVVPRHLRFPPSLAFWPILPPLTHFAMKTKGLIVVLIGALLLGSCDLLKTKESMDAHAKEMIKDPEEKNPPGKD